MAGPVRWGILSTARINDALLPPLRQSPESEVVAVASRSQGRADAYAREREIPRAYGSYDALLADPDVEAVYLSVPNGAHVEWSIRCLEAGKHVLCEKPFTRSPEGAERAYDAADRSGRLLMEAFMWRHHAQTKKLVELVDGDAIGDLRLIRAAFSFTLEREGDVRLEPELEGGALMDVGAYCVSGLRLFGGEPEAVSAQHVVGPTGVDVRFAGTLAFSGGALGLFHCGFDLPYGQELELHGSEGRLSVAMPFAIREPGVDVWRGDRAERIEFDPEDRYRAQVDNFSRAVRGTEQQLLGRDDAVGQARTLDALHRSAEAGGAPVRLT
jgi:D-xylose 1-dehydrogenase (NADP+, D-xylono-1,5-lactone-forming)